jgi:AraC-like DNA-binding protein
VPSQSPSDAALPEYSERAPGAALAPWVECYWRIRATDAPSAQNRVLPDGCSDIIIGLGDTPGPVIIGTMRTAAVFTLAGAIDFFGVRFRPGRALPFLGMPLSEITDCRVPLDSVWGPDAQRLADVAPSARMACAEAMLIERLVQWTRGREGEEALVANAVGLLRRARGGASVRAVADALGVGERRLERAFDRCVGVNPKTFERVLRLRRAVRRVHTALHADAPLSWTDVAFGAGYADQSHLIREFRALAGLTPVRYVAERRGVGFVQDDDDASA